MAQSNEALAGKNFRRRMKTTVTELEFARKIAKGIDAKKEYTKQLQEARRQIKRSYMPKRGWNTEKQKARLADAIKKGDEITKFARTNIRSAQKARNFNFQQQLNWASSANKQAMSYLSEQEVKAFYRITEPIWNKREIPISKRNEAIMKYFKEPGETMDLETAFKRAMKLPGVREKVEKEIEYQKIKEINEEDWTPDQRAFYEDYTADQQGLNEGSPEWSMNLTEFDTKKDWKENISGEVNK